MMSIQRLLPALLITSMLAGVSTGLMHDEKECILWNTVMDALKTDGTFNLTCVHNQQCTGFSCSGTISIPNKTPIDFSANFLPCKEPQQLEISVSTIHGNVSLPMNISTTRTVQSLPVPTSYGIQLGSVRTVLNVGLQTLGNNNVKLDVNASLTVERLSTSYVLVPPTVIRLPNCIKSGNQYNYTATDSMTDIPCSVNTMHSCGDYQSCYTGNQTKGAQCMCMHGLVWNRSKLKCLPPTARSSSSSSDNNVVIIVVCSLLGVVSIAVILAVIVKYRRYRQRYGQHELLINNEGTDRDLDGDSPMLNG